LSVQGKESPLNGKTKKDPSFGSGSFFVFESEAFQLASSAILVTARSAVMEAKMKIHSNSQELA
jgi:hypothetical protein